MSATSGAGTFYSSGSPEFTPVCSGVRVTRYLALCVCFIDRWFSFCTFSFGHCVVCSSIYGFWLSLWCLQTLLHNSNIHVHSRLPSIYSFIWFLTAFHNFRLNADIKHGLRRVTVIWHMYFYRFGSNISNGFSYHTVMTRKYI
jgi:hypothetical protein